MKRLLFLFGLLAFLMVAPYADAAGPPLDNGQTIITFTEMPDALALVADTGADFADGFIVDKTILLADEPVAFIRMQKVITYRADAIWSIEPSPEPPDQSWQSDDNYYVKLLPTLNHRLCDNLLHIDPGLNS